MPLPGMERRALKQQFGLSLRQQVPGPVLLPHGWVLFPKAGGLLTQASFVSPKPRPGFSSLMKVTQADPCLGKAASFMLVLGTCLAGLRDCLQQDRQTARVNLLSIHSCSPEISTTLTPREKQAQFYGPW